MLLAGRVTEQTYLNEIKRHLVCLACQGRRNRAFRPRDRASAMLFAKGHDVAELSISYE